MPLHFPTQLVRPSRDGFKSPQLSARPGRGKLPGEPGSCQRFLPVRGLKCPLFATHQHRFPDQGRAFGCHFPDDGRGILARHDRFVSFLDQMTLEPSRRLAVGRRVPGENHQATHFKVEPVNREDLAARLPLEDFPGTFAGIRVSRPGWHGQHAVRLVDDDEMLVLENGLQETGP